MSNALQIDFGHKTKVTIAIPVWNDNFLHEFRDSLDKLIEYSYRNGIVLDVRRYERIRIDIARDNAVREAIEQDSDYLLFVDDDNPVKPDSLVKLLSHNKDIIGGLIPRRNPPHVPCVFKYNKDYLDGIGYKPLDRTELSEGVHEVSAIGMGCTLISKQCFKEVYEKNNNAPFAFVNEIVNGRLIQIGEDIAFCRRAKKIGFKVWYDSEVRPGHIIKSPVVGFDSEFNLEVRK